MPQVVLPPESRGHAVQVVAGVWHCLGKAPGSLGLLDALLRDVTMSYIPSARLWTLLGHLVP